MEHLRNVITFLEEFWITSSEFLSELFTSHDFGFMNVDFLHFWTASTLTVFLGVAVIKWIVN